MWQEQRSWLKRQTGIISLAISSDPQAGTAHMPSGFSADRIQKISLFLTPDRASGEDQHPSQFWQFAKTQTGLDYKSEALVAAEKCIFCH